MEEMGLFMAGLIGGMVNSIGGRHSLRSRRCCARRADRGQRDQYLCLLCGLPERRRWIPSRAVDTPISFGAVGHNRRWFWRMALAANPTSDFLTGDSMATAAGDCTADMGRSASCLVTSPLWRASHFFMAWRDTAGITILVDLRLRRLLQCRTWHHSAGLPDTGWARIFI